MPAPGLAFVVLLLLSAALTAGCFTENVAEGRYVETPWSARVAALESSERGGPLARLSLVVFDGEGGGVLEEIVVRDYASFESFPEVMTAADPQYFCARLQTATSRNDELELTYLDALNRLWILHGTVDEGGEIVRAQFERLTASGEPVIGAAPIPMSLERVTDDVDDELLDCIDHAFEIEVTLRLSDLADFEALDLADDGRLRIAMLVTQAQTSTDAAQPLAGATITQTEVASLDIDFDVVDSERVVVLRLPPDDSLLADLEAGLAVASFVVFEDRPLGAEAPNDDWNRGSGATEPRERIVAYSPSRVLVWNAADDELATTARDRLGNRVPEPLFEEGRHGGWSSYAFFAEAVTLDDGLEVSLVHQFTDASSAMELETLPMECHYCYPSQPTSEQTPDGAVVDCDLCPAILPLLFY